MVLKTNSRNITEIVKVFENKKLQPRFFNTSKDKVQLVKKLSTNRSEWEKLRTESNEHTSTYANQRVEDNLWHPGFGRNVVKKTKMGYKYMGLLQSVSKSTSEEKMLNLFAEISQYIDEFTPHELIDICYFMTRINREGCSQVVEPILHRFFSLPERHSFLSGVYLHRLLRSMFIFQDVTYRVWVYEIAQMVSYKHDHLLMRDVQLVIDDLSLFYDSAAQGALNLLEETVVKRIDELEIFRMPLVIHALGRCGYNSINVVKTVHKVFLENINREGLYSPHMVGLLLKGYTSFHFNPGTEFLESIWNKMKGILKKLEFKYVSWMAESFVRLRYFKNISILLDELIEKRSFLTHLEFTDFMNICWSIQSYLLSFEFRPYIVPGYLWQEKDHSEGEEGSEEVNNNNDNNNNNNNNKNKKELIEKPSKETIDMLYNYYNKLYKLFTEEVPLKIYGATPPYRATQFEIMTRLLLMYPNPRDFTKLIPLRKYDAAYPVVKFPNEVEFKEGDYRYILGELNYLKCSKFFGEQRNYSPESTRNDNNNSNNDNNINNNPETKNNNTNNNFNPEDLVLSTTDEPLKSVIQGKGELELKPLNPILRNFIHSLFFRTPALAPRGLRILTEGLARIHFERREDNEIDKDLLPNMKVKYYSRAMSRAIVREIYRKLACFNTDDLLITLFGMISLRMFEIDLAKEVVNQSIEMWVHQKTEKLLRDEQKEMISIFFKTFESTYPEIHSTLDAKSINLILEYT